MALRFSSIMLRLSLVALGIAVLASAVHAASWSQPVQIVPQLNRSVASYELVPSENGLDLFVLIAPGYEGVKRTPARLVCWNGTPGSGQWDGPHGVMQTRIIYHGGTAKDQHVHWDAAATGGRLYAVVDHHSKGDINTDPGYFFYSASSQDGGRTWSKPEKVVELRDSGDGNFRPICWPTLFIHEGKRHLLWKKIGGEVFHRVLGDGPSAGERLTSNQNIVWPGGFINVAATPHGLTVITDDGTGAAFILTYDGQWREKGMIRRKNPGASYEYIGTVRCLFCMDNRLMLAGPSKTGMGLGLFTGSPGDRWEYQGTVIPKQRAPLLYPEKAVPYAFVRGGECHVLWYYEESMRKKRIFHSVSHDGARTFGNPETIMNGVSGFTACEYDGQICVVATGGSWAGETKPFYFTSYPAGPPTGHPEPTSGPAEPPSGATMTPPSDSASPGPTGGGSSGSSQACSPDPVIPALNADGAKVSDICMLLSASGGVPVKYDGPGGKRVDVHVQNQKLSAVLTSICADTGLQWQQRGEEIHLW